MLLCVAPKQQLYRLTKTGQAHLHATIGEHGSVVSDVFTEQSKSLYAKFEEPKEGTELYCIDSWWRPASSVTSLALVDGAHDGCLSAGCHYTAMKFAQGILGPTLGSRKETPCGRSVKGIFTSALKLSNFSIIFHFLLLFS
jgi:hypothetical protein